MKKLYPLNGIVPVLNTPFNKHDEVDIAALKKNTELSIQAGVAGFLVPAMAFEVYKLSRNERKLIVRAVLEQTNSRVSVIGGAAETDPTQRIRIIKDGVKYSQVLNATKGRLNISGGWAVMQMIEALDRGVHAFMTTAMNEIYVQIYNLYTSNNKPQARKLFYQLLPILAFSNQHLDISIHFFKHLLHRQGIYPTPNVRQPILPFDKFHISSANQLIDKVIAIIDD